MADSDDGSSGYDSSTPRRDPRRLFYFTWLWTIPGLGILGVICTAFYIFGVQAGVRLSVFGTCLAIAAAAVIAGGIIGFLFGIPRTLQGPDPSTGDEQYKGNTNLEQVSDWLTKIIVGIGLVQIGRLLPALGRLGENLKEPLGGRAWSGTFGLALIISYALLGFFYLYLWSRSLLVEEWKDPNTARPTIAAQAPSTPFLPTTEWPAARFLKLEPSCCSEQSEEPFSGGRTASHEPVAR